MRIFAKIFRATVVQTKRRDIEPLIQLRERRISSAQYLDELRPYRISVDEPILSKKRPERNVDKVVHIEIDGDLCDFVDGHAHR